PATWWRWSSRSTPRCTWPPDRWPTCWTRRSRTWPAPESCTRGTGSTTPTPSSFPCTTPQATRARTGMRWPHPSPATSTTTRAICPPTTTSARTTLGSRGSPSACGRWRSDGREGRHPHRGPWRTGESGHGWGSAGVNGKAGGGTARDRQGIPVGHPGVCWCWSPGVPGRGSGPRKTGGGGEGVPLGGRAGQVATVGVLGIPHGRATGEVGHFDAVVVHTCVAALTEGGGDVGHFDTVLALSSAVAALPENQFVAH